MGMSNIENIILSSLYEAIFSNVDALRLTELRDKNNWDREEYRKAVDLLEAQELIRPLSFGDICEITLAGIAHVEKNKIAPAEILSNNNLARVRILAYLFSMFEQYGRDRDVHFKNIAEEIKMSESVVEQNLGLLRDMGYVESSSMGCFELTASGIRVSQRLQEQNSLVGQYKEISALAPTVRGGKLNHLFAKIAEVSGWRQETGVKTTSEEMDVVISKRGEYYLVECKWWKDPIEAKEVRDFIVKVNRRAGCGGIFLSMSGFSNGAIEELRENLSDSVILCYGKEDLEHIVGSVDDFEEVLTGKYDKAIKTKELAYE